jgi:hypothetical protein
MTWLPEVEEIERRRQLAQDMGGEERVARQHSEPSASGLRICSTRALSPNTVLWRVA